MRGSCSQPTGEAYDTALRMLLLGSAVLVVLGTAAAVLDQRLSLFAGAVPRISRGVLVELAEGHLGYAVVQRSPMAAVTPLGRVQAGRQRPAAMGILLQRGAPPRTATTVIG